MILFYFPIFLVLFGGGIAQENTEEENVPDTRVWTREELLTGFVKKVDHYLDLLSEVYQNKTNTESQMVNILCQCAYIVFNYEFKEDRASTCEHMANRLPLVEGGSFSRNYVYMADQLKTTVLGLDLQSHGIMIYACRRSRAEFLDLSPETRKAIAKELFELETMPNEILKKMDIIEVNEKFRNLPAERARIVARTFLRSPSDDTNMLKRELDGLVSGKFR